RLSSHWPTQPVCIDIAVGNNQESRMEMEIMLPPASPGDPAENGSHLANADGDSGSFCSGSDGTAAGTAGSPLQSPFCEQNFSTSLLSYSAIRKSLAFSEGEGAKERKEERKDGRKEGGTNACA
ncbi:hypothetical protein ALC60_12744, partial [Trachymyrmex zeteki]